MGENLVPDCLTVNSRTGLRVNEYVTVTCVRNVVLIGFFKMVVLINAAVKRLPYDESPKDPKPTPPPSLVHAAGQANRYAGGDSNDRRGRGMRDRRVDAKNSIVTLTPEARFSTYAPLTFFDGKCPGEANHAVHEHLQ
eukprot:7013242-Prymnesium_polylepis.1